MYRTEYHADNRSPHSALSSMSILTYLNLKSNADFCGDITTLVAAHSAAVFSALQVPRVGRVGCLFFPLGVSGASASRASVGERNRPSR